MRLHMILLSVVVLANLACERKRSAPDRPSPVPVPTERQPVRTAAQDSALRVLIAEVASARACDMMRGQFRPLRAQERPGVVTGVLWVRGCRVTHEGKRVTIDLSGDGWQFADKQMKKAGGTFALRQYVKFVVHSRIRGALDVSYSPRTHVLSLWFSPAAPPEVDFRPIGDLDVDRESAWASIVGGIGSLLGQSPESVAEKQADKEGTGEMGKQFARGLSVTVQMCTGVARFGLGRPDSGRMMAPEVGESTRVPAELHPGGLLLFGPYPAARGFTMPAQTSGGAARIELMCADDAEGLARAYAEGGVMPPRKLLAASEVRGKAVVKVKRQRCPVVVAAWPLGDVTVSLDWKRPPWEGAAGKLIDCSQTAQ